MLLVAGFILVYNPALLKNEPLPTDPYQVIEKRVRWGLVIGFGLLLLFHHPWNHWGFAVSEMMVFITFGIILARILGFLLDGYFAKQMLWLGIEVSVLLLLGFLYWKLKQ